MPLTHSTHSTQKIAFHTNPVGPETYCLPAADFFSLFTIHNIP